jgi:tRNA threonylcarbamoyl adenosine modification protein YjeE
MKRFWKPSRWRGSMSAIERIIEDEGGTKTLAAFLATHCPYPACITLSGDLGAGKTTFTQYFIRQLAPNAGDITSPTFTLAQQYDLPEKKSLWHIDLYRIKHEGELAEIGLEEGLQIAICIIEWPEIAEHLLPQDRLSIEITQLEGDKRKICLYSDAQTWNTLLCKLP